MIARAGRASLLAVALALGLGARPTCAHATHAHTSTHSINRAASGRSVTDRCRCAVSPRPPDCLHACRCRRPRCSRSLAHSLTRCACMCARAAAHRDDFVKRSSAAASMRRLSDMRQRVGQGSGCGDRGGGGGTLSRWQPCEQQRASVRRWRVAAADTSAGGDRSIVRERAMAACEGSGDGLVPSIVCAGREAGLW